MVGLKLELIIFLCFASYLLGISIGPTTNLKDIQEDKKRKYKTLVNSIKTPRLTAAIFLSFSFLIISIIYGVLNATQIWLLFFPFILLSFTIRQICKNKIKQALIYLRFYLINSMIILIWSITSNLTIIIISSGILLIQLIIIIKGLKWNTSM